MQYYEINEQTARRANDVNSMSQTTVPAALRKNTALPGPRPPRWWRNASPRSAPTITTSWMPCLTATPAALPTTTTPITATNRPALHPCLRRQQLPGTQNKSRTPAATLWQEYKEIDAIPDKIRSWHRRGRPDRPPRPRTAPRPACSRNKTPLIIARPPMPTTASTKPCAAMPASPISRPTHSLDSGIAFSVKLYGKPYGDFELSSLRGKIPHTSPPCRSGQTASRRPAARQHHEIDGAARSCAMPKKTACKSCSRNPRRRHPRCAEIQRFPLVAPQQAWQKAQLTQNAEYAACRVLGL